MWYKQSKSYIGFGKYNKLPHYSIIGSSAEFYVWVEENKGYDYNDKSQGNSSWLRGKEAFKTYWRLHRVWGKSLNQVLGYTATPESWRPTLDVIDRIDAVAEAPSGHDPVVWTETDIKRLDDSLEAFFGPIAK